LLEGLRPLGPPAGRFISQSSSSQNAPQAPPQGADGRVEGGKGQQAGTSGAAAGQGRCATDFRNGKKMCFCGGLRRNEDDEWDEDVNLIPGVFRRQGNSCGSVRSQTQCAKVVFQDIPDAWPEALIQGLNNNGSGLVCQPCRNKINDAQKAATNKGRKGKSHTKLVLKTLGISADAPSMEEEEEFDEEEQDGDEEGRQAALERIAKDALEASRKLRDQLTRSKTFM
jgi:hypothetical protein